MGFSRFSTKTDTFGVKKPLVAFQFDGEFLQNACLREFLA
jgi:hypothetical protein